MSSEKLYIREPMLAVSARANAGIVSEQVSFTSYKKHVVPSKLLCSGFQSTPPSSSHALTGTIIILSAHAKEGMFICHRAFKP